MSITIRPASEADIPALAAIWNPIIRDTTIIFSDEEKTPDDIAAMIASRPAFLVAEVEGTVAGLATYGQFRPSNGYRAAMEHTVLIAPEAKARGLGRALMAAIEADAKGRGFHVMLGVVSHENAAGIAFHRAVGYRETGRLTETGQKFGRWLDAVVLQKIL
ncbi:N-acetyltransferase family protein [Pseudoroseicyclus sp. CXY001]|uniref:GNAT family N-acetyltransferase n=1 Tax=Pseudoroseicyclus sp. CXY001 TaxID=3242492 RepID=UPI003570BCA6